jgi:hypothetical protein
LWAAQIASTGGERGLGIATDTAGNVVVTGWYGAALTLYNTGGTTGATLGLTGSLDCFIAKYSSAGAVLWAAQIVSTSDDYGHAIATDTSGNVLVTGTYGSGAALTLYNTGGTPGGTLPIPAGGLDCFIAKYSSAGAVLWAARIGSADNDIGYSIATDTSGNVFVTGAYNAALTLYNTGGTTGATLGFTGGANDAFIAKYSSAGAVLWAAQISSTGNEDGKALDTDSSGNVFVTGIYRAALTLYNTGGTPGATLAYVGGGNDAFIAKYSSAGAVLWAAQIAGTTTSDDFGNAIATDPSGNVLVTGSYGSGGALTLYNTGGTTGATLALTGGSDCFIAKYTSDGYISSIANSLNVAGGYYVNGVKVGSTVIGYSNVATGTSLSVSANTYGTHFNITTPTLSAITLPTISWINDSNSYWVFRNNTGNYLSITFTYTSAGSSAPVNPVTIPPANSVTVLLNYNSSGPSSNYVLF